VSLRDIAEMSAEDKARAAERLLDDRFAMGLLAIVEQQAIENMLTAEDDWHRREARDTVLTVRGFVQALRNQKVLLKEERRVPQGVV
jgi:hypothetical protein